MKLHSPQLLRIFISQILNGFTLYTSVLCSYIYD